MTILSSRTSSMGRGRLPITAKLSGEELVEASIAVGPESTRACRITNSDTHLGSTAPDARSFEGVLRQRLAEVGVGGHSRAGSD